ncbi:MAG: FixH family protein [Saprospiraceae bacterium]|nr:FixH family protein [Saprospiraceae bacterium]
MNWGHKLLIVIIGFVLMIVVFVLISFKETNPIIEENYYDRELKYQSLIDGSENMLLLDSKLQVLKEENSTVVILPLPESQRIDSGKIEFIHWQDPINDLALDLHPGQSKKIEISDDKLGKGSYLVKVTIHSLQKFYYAETKFLKE